MRGTFLSLFPIIILFDRLETVHLTYARLKVIFKFKLIDATYFRLQRYELSLSDVNAAVIPKWTTSLVCSDTDMYSRTNSELINDHSVFQKSFA